MAVRIFLVSDLHLEDLAHESWNPTAQRDFDILACAGDVVASDPAACVDVLARLAQGRPAVFVLGNRDVWNLTLQGALDTARTRNPDVHVLEAGGSITLLGLTIAGGTLWNDPDDWPPGIPRVRADDATPSGEPVFVDRSGGKVQATLLDLAKVHHATMDAIAAAEPDIVLTHYPPSDGDLARLGKPTTWLHGHIHSSLNETRGAHHVVRAPFRRSINLLGALVEVGPGLPPHAVSLVVGTGQFRMGVVRSIYDQA
jgi:calcineurin-like phosphoesterase family protein